MYGQTCSGKTYTMLGNENERGFLPLALDYLFEQKKSVLISFFNINIFLKKGKVEYSLSISYLELYNESVKLTSKNRLMQFSW